MNVYTLAEELDLSAASSVVGDAVDLSGENFPFQPGNDVLLITQSADLSDATIAVKGSEDDSSYTSYDTLDVPGFRIASVNLKRYVRIDVTQASTPAGTANIYLIGN